MSKIDSKQINYVNSHNRSTGTNSDFIYEITLDPRNNFDRITLLQATIPKSYYNCQAGTNYFVLKEGATQITIDVPPGNYNRNSMAVVIGGLLTSNSPNNWTYVISFDNPTTQGDTGLYTFTVSGNSGQPALIFDSITLISEMLGFTSGIWNFLGNILVSSQVINLQPFESIQIHCSMVANPFQTGLNTDILQTIMVNAGTPSYSNVQWICPEFESFSHEIIPGATGNARFFLTDEDGIPVDTNGVGMQLVIMFWKKNKSLRLLTGFIKLVSGLIYNQPEDVIT